MHVIRDVSVEIIEVPLRNLFVTARDKLARQVSRPVVITVEMDDGARAEGEAVPVAYVTGETPESVVEAVGRVRTLLIGLDVSRLRPALDVLEALLVSSPSARAGIEQALYAAHARAAGLSLWRLWGGALASVETDITLSMVPDVVDRAEEAAARGFRIFKMKIGSPDPDEDFARLLSVHHAAPGARLRLDANQAFTAEQALRFIRRSLDAGVPLELVEQPVDHANLDALDAVAAASPVPIIADEAVKTPADALRLVSRTRVHGINVKVMKAGLAGALDIVAIARAAQRKLMIGCMLETRRGLSFSVALACGTGAFDYVDLDSHALLDEPGENRYFSEDGPRLSVL